VSGENISPVRPGFGFAFASVSVFAASWHPMTVSHQDVALQLIRDYQSFNSHSIECCIVPPTALEFSRYVRSNRPIVIKSCTISDIFDKQMQSTIGQHCENGKIWII
jgi:hypothetical protein